METYLILLSCSGTTYILKYAKPLNGIRVFFINKFSWFSDLIKCEWCLGFWVGIFWALILNKSLSYQEILLLPTASCAFCGILGLLADRLELG